MTPPKPKKQLEASEAWKAVWNMPGGKASLIVSGLFGLGFLALIGGGVKTIAGDVAAGRYESSCKYWSNPDYNHAFDHDYLDANYMTAEGVAKRDGVNFWVPALHVPTNTFVVPPAGVIRSRMVCDESLRPADYDLDAFDAKKTETVYYEGLAAMQAKKT